MTEAKTADDAEAAALAEKMARAAGKVTPLLMARAAYMLVCVAAIAKDPEGYFEFLARKEEERQA